MTNGNQLSREEHALLVEYQVCQGDNSANFQGFWTLAAIFIGLSSAFLAGLLYAFIANETLIDTLLADGDAKKPLVIGIIALLVGIANIIILVKLKGWHRRIMFNQGLNLERMREIEIKLGMRKSLRAFAIEDWEKLEQQLNEFDKDKLNKIKEELQEYGKNKRENKSYEPPSSRKHFPCILCTLMSLWGFVVIVGVSFIAIAIYIASNH